MRAFVITLTGHEYSERKSAECIRSARDIGGIEVERFTAIPKETAFDMMRLYGFRWTWAKGNTADDVCPITKLKQHPYGNLQAKIGCFMSHLMLWYECVEINEPIMILEHDAMFVKRFEEFDFKGICQINDPKGATPRGDWWSCAIKMKGDGVHQKTKVFDDDKPDGLAGNSAYVIKPHAALCMLGLAETIGVWPNDALMCRQLVPYLEELYPFVTRVDQQVSTTSQ